MTDTAGAPSSFRPSDAGALCEARPTLLGALGEARIGGLDFLRAIAVLFVMLEHAMDASSPAALRFAASGLSSLGVEIFFVLSGFLISWMLLEEFDKQGRIDYLAFYRRRIARLMPVFYLFLLLVLLVLWGRGREIPWPEVASAVLYVVNYYQGLAGLDPSIIAHTWSLAVEEQFYVVWPIAAGVLLARRMTLARALVVVILCVWFLRAALFLSGEVPIGYLYRALETRADHLGVGCLVAVAIRSPVWRARIEALLQWRHVLPLLWILLYVSAHVDSMSGLYKYCVGYVLEPVIVGLLIPLSILASKRTGRAVQCLNNGMLVHLGRISYGVYLFHGMIMYTVQRLVVDWTGSFVLGLVSACVAVIGFATIVFRWYEVPMRRWINTGWVAQRR